MIELSCRVSDQMVVLRKTAQACKHKPCSLAKAKTALVRYASRTSLPKNFRFCYVPAVRK
jgi:hypothetical protein